MTTVASTEDWAPRAAAYADLLVDRGAITDPAWRETFAAVPRHLFVPQYWALDTYNAPDHLVSGTDRGQRGQWLDAVYSDELLITQWAPQTRPDGTTVRVVTSSASQPYVVAVELDRLGVGPGARIREIGTGSGYSTALLCARYGDSNVSSVDIHPDLVVAARGRLAAAGYRPRVYAGDGGAADPDGGLFDAIISTCAVSSIPAAWIDQLAPDGRIVTPMTWGGALVVVTKTSENTVTGRIDREPMWFMPLRAHADESMPAGYVPDIPRPDGAPHEGLTDVDPRLVNDPDLRLWLTLHLPGLQIAWTCDHDSTDTGVIVYTADEHATASYEPNADGLWPVIQYRHRIWDTIETAYHAWVRTGRPTRDRLVYTTTGDGQHVTLDHPAGYAWPVPA